jgi:uncharacterized protein YqgC (DUF456 family)
MAFVFALLLILVLVGCWLLTMLGLPGNWLIVSATAAYAYLMPSGSSTALGWRTVVATLVLAVLGEAIELVASAVGVSKTGGSRRSAIMALIGSLIGGLVGIVVGVPIPVLGSVVAAVLFAAIGAMAGAVLGELSLRQTASRSWRVGKAAFWGRLAGTLGKMLLGAIMIAAVIAAMLA